MDVRWTRSATRHRIGRERSGYVVRNPVVHLVDPATETSPEQDDRHVFLGCDADGIALEVMAVETEAGFLIIHAMLIRAKYLSYLEGATDEQA